MNRTKLLPIVLLIAGLLLSLTANAQDWAGTSRIDGQVVDEAGEPIADATVSIELNDASSKPDPMTTNGKGKWSAVGLRGGTWIVIVEADGYIGNKDFVQLSSTGARERKEIVLREVPQEVKDAAKQNEAVKMAESGNKLLESGEYDAARAEYLNAIEKAREEDKPMLYLTIAETYSVETDHEQAIAAIEKGLAIDSENPKLLKLMAAELAAMGKTEEAATFLAKLPEDDVNPSTYFNIGISAYNAGDMDKALDNFKKGLALEPDRAEGYYYRGLANLSQEHNAEALADLQKFLELAPTDERAVEAKSFIEYLETL